VLARRHHLAKIAKNASGWPDNSGGAVANLARHWRDK